MIRDRPFSIVRRMMALVVGVSLVSGALYLLALFLVLRPFVGEIVERLIGQIGAVERAMQAVPRDGRDALAAALRADRVAVGRAPSIASPVEGDVAAGLPVWVGQRLDAGLGRRVRVVTGQDAGGSFELAVDIPVEDEVWWLTVGGVRPSLGRALLPLFGGLALIGVAAGLTLVVGVRLVTRPMSDLARELLARGERLTPLEAPPRASVELQGVIRSFNAMVAAVEDAERARHDLLAGASHDLRTPLARLRLRAEIEGAPELADKMEPDFIAMSRIIDQFLAYAQGRRRYADAACLPLGEVIEALVVRYREEGVDISFDGLPEQGPALPEIAVQRVLTNLIDNALTHGAEPVEVGLVTTAAEVGVSVLDAGRGIPADAFAEAQKPFVRLHPRGASDGHCGLGLAIVAQVAESLGGRLALHAFDGRRSGVGLWLPLRAIDRSPPHDAA